MKLNPFTVLIKMFKWLSKDIKTNKEIKEHLWKKGVVEWIRGTLEWLNNPTVLPPSDTLEEIFTTVIAAEGYVMLTGSSLPREHRSIHNLLEYILRSEGKVNITCVAEPGAEQKVARRVSHPACRKLIVDAFMDFSKPIEDMEFYQLCSDVTQSKIIPTKCDAFTALLACGYAVDHELTLPDDIRLCDNCLDLYYRSALTQPRPKRAEYSTDPIQMFVWIKNTITVIFNRRELDLKVDRLRKEVSFVIWYAGLIKAHRMDPDNDTLTKMVDNCVDRFRRRIDQRELK